MDKWEYTIVDLNHAEIEKSKELLDKLGRDGWELVSAVQVSIGVSSCSRVP